jgi:hypothetical protein
MPRTLGLFVLFFILGCASGGSGRPDGVAEPTIVIQQSSPIYFGSTTSAPVSLNVYVRNNANVPIRVRQIEIRSPGMSQFTLIQTSRLFGETIPPGETRTLSLMATAVRSQTRFRAEEPLSVVAVIRMEAKGQEFRQIVMEQFAGAGTT